MARPKDTDWNLRDGKPDGKGGRVHLIESIHAALLMDIRDELKELNCRLRNLANLSVSIRRNTTWSRRKHEP
jgi:hypothetical protein